MIASWRVSAAELICTRPSGRSVRVVGDSRRTGGTKGTQIPSRRLLKALAGAQGVTRAQAAMALTGAAGASGQSDPASEVECQTDRSRQQWSLRLAPIEDLRMPCSDAVRAAVGWPTAFSQFFSRRPPQFRPGRCSATAARNTPRCVSAGWCLTAVPKTDKGAILQADQYTPTPSVVADFHAVDREEGSGRLRPWPRRQWLIEQLSCAQLQQARRGSHRVEARLLAGCQALR